MMFDAEAIGKAQARMESARSTVDTTRQEIAELVLVSNAAKPAFLGSYGFNQGQAVSQSELMDEEGLLSLYQGVSLFEGWTMPRGERWQKPAPPNDDDLEDDRIARQFETVGKRLFMLRNDPASGFADAMHQSALSAIGLGEFSLWVDIRKDDLGVIVGLSYQPEAIGGVWVERDAEGRVMRAHRKIVLTAEQAQAKFGDDCPPEVVKALTGTNRQPDREFEFIHVIERNFKRVPGRIDLRGRPWVGCYYSCTDKVVFKEGGYRTLRRIIGTWARELNENYGRGQCHLMLPSLRAIQLIMQDRMIAAEKAAKPNWYTNDDALDNAVLDLGPDGVTRGALDHQGRQMVRPETAYADISPAKDLHEEKRTVIRRALFLDLLQLFRDLKTHISALRTSEEVAEKGVLLNPLARQETEWFAPMMAVELDLMDQIGALDDIDADVRALLVTPERVTARYDNELSRMQDAAVAVGVLRTAEQVQAISPLVPDIGAAFAREFPPDRLIRTLGHVNGIPASLRASEEEKAAYDEAAARDKMTATLIEGAQPMADAAYKLAQAGNINGR